MIATHRAPLGGLALALTLAACEGSPAGTDTDSSETATSTTAPRDPVPLVDLPAWQEAEAIDDPLADHRPDPDVCPTGSVFMESLEVEIDTNFCTYAMLRWPALVEVPAGSDITLSFRHYDLIAAAPATAHVALLVDTTIVWEQTITIPGPAQVVNETVTVDQAFPIGAPVYFHLHNHGQNNYILSSITTTPP
ncbi:MAG: hypothetical protein R3B09_19100 [Nannocystaceae bacterium]